MVRRWGGVARIEQQTGMVDTEEEGKHVERRSTISYTIMQNRPPAHSSAIPDGEPNPCDAHAESPLTSPQAPFTDDAPPSSRPCRRKPT